MDREFKEKVLRVVQKIPRGRTLAYKEVADMAGKSKAWRAVGNILNKNFNPKIPCHRVIRSDGKIGGYNRGTRLKYKLLLNDGGVAFDKRTDIIKISHQQLTNPKKTKI